MICVVRVWLDIVVPLSFFDHRHRVIDLIPCDLISGEFRRCFVLIGVI